jgi:hypothetical protein
MKRKWLACLGMLVGLAGALIGTAYALPNSFNGRVSNNGYLSNEYGNYHDWVFVPFPADEHLGLTSPNLSTTGDCNISCTITLASFIQVYQARLDDTSVADAGRAAAEIDMMLGQTQPAFTGPDRNGAAPAVTSSPGIVAGIAYAKAHFAQWSAMVTAIANNQLPGYQVKFNSYDFFPGTPKNPGWNGMGVTAANDPTDITDCTSGQGCSGDIAVYQGFTAGGFDYDVNFTMPNGTHFFIKHKCANLTNDLTPFEVPSSTITITKTSTEATPMPIGTQFQYNLNVKEANTIPLNQVSVTDTIPSQFKYTGVASGTPVPTTVSGQTLTWTFTSPADAAVLSNIASGGGENLGILVTAETAGTNIVNTSTGTATNEYGVTTPVKPGSTIDTVSPQTHPIVHGSNSDVQAGGGLCGGTMTNGMVEGNSSNESTDQYVVSASASNGIINFGSNNAVSGSSADTLKLGDQSGETGGYNEVCREDLVSAATAYYDSDEAGIQMIAGSNLNLTGASGLYYYTGGGTLTLSGVVSRKITVIDINSLSTILINGAITLGGGTSLATNTPSVGVISAGDIDISSSVTTVAAYLFADGAIDTCIEGNTTCDNELTVDGFLMGHTLLLKRLGPSTSPDATAENIVMNPEIYLNPPQFFDTSVDDVLLEGQGEQQPLF